jgi:hypothetical protein
MFDLSIFIKELKGGFAQWYNRRHARYGVLWADRFKSVLLEGGEALAAVAAYIELNPTSSASWVTDVGALPRAQEPWAVLTRFGFSAIRESDRSFNILPARVAPDLPARYLALPCSFLLSVCRALFAETSKTRNLPVYLLPLSE